MIWRQGADAKRAEAEESLQFRESLGIEREREIMHRYYYLLLLSKGYTSLN
jgi:hypothetical protein